MPRLDVIQEVQLRNQLQNLIQQHRDLDTAVHSLEQTGTGDQLQLRALPPALREGPPPRPWWRRGWRPDPAADALAVLRREVDAVLVLLPPGPGAGARPGWLGALSRPLLLLSDADTAVAPQLPLRALDDGWLTDGLLWQALAQALPDDRRRQRLEAAWRRAQRVRLDDAASVLADGLARLALAREPLPETGLFGAGGAEAARAAETARQRLLQQLDAEFTTVAERLASSWGPGEPAPPGPGTALQPRRQARVAEGRAALWGGVASGALAGLKADLATGGLTLGAGAVAGGLIGALGAAGVARGLNAARGRAQSHVDWGADELDAMAAALLRLPLGLAAPAPSAAAGRARREAALQAALQAEAGALAAAWRDRGPTLAARLAPVLLRVLEAALGRPADYTPAP
jgi:hypothetical protein